MSTKSNIISIRKSLPREFTGQTYIGKKYNRDIDMIQLTSVLEDLSNYTNFCALTKDDSVNAGRVLYLEGRIYSNLGVDISGIESDSSDSYMEINIIGLEESIMNAYKNLTTAMELEIGGKEKRKRGTDSETRLYVSDLEEDFLARYPSDNSSEETAGSPRSRHIRIGYTRIMRGKRVPCSPSVVHAENFTDEELLDLGFSPDGIPSVEVVRDYSDMTEEEKEKIIERRNLQSIETIRRKYKLEESDD
jgi:hypothetical protein